jgi:hypothetical protein
VTITFIDRDPEFERWRDEHPRGLIVNHYRTPSPSYLVLHRTNCVHLRTQHGSNWTSTYGKTCAEALDEIQLWARSQVGTTAFHRCAACEPTYH